MNTAPTCEGKEVSPKALTRITHSLAAIRDRAEGCERHAAELANKLFGSIPGNSNITEVTETDNFVDFCTTAISETTAHLDGLVNSLDRIGKELD